MKKGNLKSYSIFTADFETFTASSQFYKNNNKTAIYAWSLVQTPLKYGRESQFYQYENKEFKITNGCSIDEFINYLIRDTYRKFTAHNLIYFHNGYKFDSEFIEAFLIEQHKDKYKMFSSYKEQNEFKLIDKSWFWTLLNAGSEIKILTISVPRFHGARTRWYHFYFRDSLKLFLGSVAQWAKILENEGIKNLPKIAVDNDEWLDNWYYDKHHQKFKDLPQLLKDRVNNDSLIMAELLTKRFSDGNFLTKGSEIPFSAPSLAVNHMLAYMAKTHFKQGEKFIFQKMLELIPNDQMSKTDYLKLKDKQNKQHAYVLENNIYLGGLTTLNHHYKNQTLQKIYSYDINSMYPYQMTKPLPIGYWTKTKTEPIDNSKFIVAKAIIYNVKQIVKAIPPLLDFKFYIDKQEVKGQKLKGLNKGYECLEYHFYGNVQELNLLLHSGIYTYDKVKIDHYLSWKTKPFLKGFIELKYHEKQFAPNTVFKLNAKLIMNSLYGKFCENANKKVKVNKGLWEICKNWIPDNWLMRPNGEHETFYHFDQLGDKPKTAYSPVAAAITSYSRIQLIEAMLWIWKHGGIVYYSDTDSIKCNIDLAPEFIDNAILGKWKFEGNAPYFKMLASKTYAGSDDNITFKKGWLSTKGCRHHLVEQQLTFKTFNYDRILDNQLIGYRVSGGVILKGIKKILAKKTLQEFNDDKIIYDI